MKESHKTALLFVLSVLAAGGALRIALSQGISSDRVMVALYYWDIVQNANPLMKGWHLITNNNYLLTGVPFNFLMFLVFGVNQLALKLGAFMVFVLCAFCGAVLISRQWNRSSGALFFFLAASSSPAALSHMQVPLARTGTICIGFLILILAMEYGSAKTRMIKYSAAAAIFCLSFAGGFSDLFFMVSLVVPLIIAMLSLRLRGKSLMPVPAEALLYALLIAAFLLGRWSMSAISGSIGPAFIGNASATDFITMRLLPESIRVFGDCFAFIFNLYGAAGILWFPLVGVFIFSTAIVLTREDDAGRAFLVRYFVLFGLALTAAFVFKVKPSGLGAARYLFPLVFIYAFAVSVALSGGHIRKKAFAAGIAALVFAGALVNIGLSYSAHSSLISDELSVAAQSRYTLKDFLLDNGLYYGYAEYWDANITTLLSGNSVKVRSVVFFEKSIEPGLWFSKSSWYSVSEYEGKTFIIETPKFRYSEISVKRLGPPEKVLNYNEYTVSVWPFNIMPRLKSLPIDADTYRDAGSVVEIADSVNGIRCLTGEKGVLFRETVSLPAGAYNAVFDISMEKAVSGEALSIIIKPLNPEYESLGINRAVPSENGKKRIIISVVSPEGSASSDFEIAVISGGNAEVLLAPPVIEIRHKPFSSGKRRAADPGKILKVRPKKDS